jgi:hypothetical protein
VLPQLGGARPEKAPPPALLYISPSGSDGGCTRAAPCKSLDRAYQIARRQTTVIVAAGRYPDQTIEPRSGGISPTVTFRPATGASVTVDHVALRGSHIEFRDMTLSDVDVPRDGTYVTFRNIRNHGFFLQGSANISFIGGEITCGTCDFHSHIDDGGPPDFRPPRNILFDGVYFHDWQAATPDQHTECLQILSGDGITIRNSVFKDCATANDGRGATANLHISWFGSGPKTRNILIENNFFYPSGNTYAIQANDFANLDFRYNSISGPIIVFGGWGDGTPVEIVGNIMRFADCKAQQNASGPVAPLNYRYNVMQGGTCGNTDVGAPSGFIDPARNLHLKGTSPAVNRGDPLSYPKRDIDGEKRPKGGRPDAGADEVR